MYLFAMLVCVLASCEGDGASEASSVAPSPTPSATTGAAPTPAGPSAPAGTPTPDPTPPPETSASDQDDRTAESRAKASRTVLLFTDPQDVGECPPEVGEDCAVDIRSVRLRTFTNDRTGRRMFALKMSAYRLYGGLIYLANIRFRFDARGGTAADADVYLSLGYVYGSAYGWLCGRAFEEEGGQYRLVEHGDSLTCFIPRRELRPTKPVRLLALSRVTRDVVDRAPDQGWAA
jgi:hypothetical protein